MNGTGDLVLYLDFDGVLHHENVKWTPQTGPYLDAPARYKLFQHAKLLAQMLEPYPAIKIVLSTSWAHRYGLCHATSRLPDAIVPRVIGSTYDAGLKYLEDFLAMPRGMQVAGDAANRHPRDWLALDDNEEGWPLEHAHRHVHTHMYEGISDSDVQAEFKRKLKEMCSAQVKAIVYPDFEPLTPSQHEVLAAHSPAVRSTVIDSLLQERLMSEHAPKALDAFMAALAPADWRCLVHQLLRYKRYGTGPVAGALSSDLRLKDIQNAFIERITNCLLSKVEQK